MRVYLTFRDGGVGFHRCLSPARFCTPDFAPLGHDILCGVDLPTGEGWHCINGLPYAETLLPLAAHKRAGGKLLWGLDDDMPNIPQWSTAKPSDPHAMSVWQLMRDLSDAIVVSTSAIAATLADVSHKVHVCPNLMDLDQFPAFDPDPEAITFSLPVKVMWAGSSTHRGDTQELVEPLDKLMRRFKPHELNVIWFGDAPPAPLIRDHLHRGVLWHQPPEPMAKYQQMLNSIRPDVCLAPLADIPFNFSKSAIRLWEAWGMQAVPVASPVGEYQIIRSGIDGRYASTADEWLSNLSRLVVDHEFRVRMAIEGRKRVESDYNWSKYRCRLPWLKFFASIIGCEVPPER